MEPDSSALWEAGKKYLPWTCNMCTMVNKSYPSVCESCDSPNPAYVPDAPDRLVFISASAMAKFFPQVPQPLYEQCLLLFGSKRSWLFPETAQQKQEARQQPGRYHLMDQAFLDFVREKERRGHAHFLKRGGLQYEEYPGEEDPDAYGRVSAWLSGDLVGAADPDMLAPACNDAERLQYNPLQLDDAFWKRCDPVTLKHCHDTGKVIRNYACGYHEYDELKELIAQSDSRLIPIREWLPNNAIMARVTASASASASTGTVSPAGNDANDKDNEVVSGIPVGKIRARLREAGLLNGVPVVLLTTGALNPVHRFHVGQLLLAREHFTTGVNGFHPIAGLMSPTHDDYVFGKLGKDLIPQKHRLPMTDIVAHEFSPDGFAMSSAWESFQEGFVDFPAVCTAHQKILRQHVDARLELVYCCGSDHAIKCGLLYGRFQHRVAVLERSDKGSTGAKVRMKQASLARTVHLIATTDDADVSSTAIRERRSQGQSVAHLTGAGVERYLNAKGLMKQAKAKTKS